MKPEEVNLKSASASTKSRNRAVLHHRRLLHIPYDKLKRLRDSKLVRGLDFTDSELKAAQESFCPGCVHGKTTKRPRPKVSWKYVWQDGKWLKTAHQKSVVPLMRIHADVMFYTKPDRRRYTCALVLVCECTGAEWVYPMQSKRECLAKFQQFLLDVSKGKGIHSLTVPL